MPAGPDADARQSLHDVLDSALVATSIGASLSVALCAAIAWLGSPLILILAGLSALAMSLRLAMVLMRRYRASRGLASPMLRLGVRISYPVHAVLAGAVAVAAMAQPDQPALHMLAVVLALGTGAGIALRLAGRTRVIAAEALLALGPTAIALWLHGGLGYQILAVLLPPISIGLAGISASVFSGVLIVLRSQREKAALAAKYERLARYDSLTGVENRMAMQMRLRDLFETTNKAQDALAVLWLDLDRFKEINDSLGHLVGDQLLCQVAEVLAGALAGRGHVARFGGDEFVIICPDADRDEARLIGAEILEHFDHGFEIGDHNLMVTASIGIAVAPQDGRDADEVMKHADMALYEAKREGRNRMTSFTWSMKDRFKRSNDIETGLRRAVENGEMWLQYQPIFDLRSGRITACEALLRWQHPTLGLVPPSEFVPAAEAIGVIEPISAWVLAQACAAAKDWPEEVRVAVNISAASLKSGELPRAIVATLLETGLAARRLELEVTESIFLGDSHHTSQMLRELQLIGLKLVLDDFGTGYSSLSYLRSYKFDTIKVDQSFMAGIGDSREDKAIIRAVGDIAETLGMDTVAEGIETEEQLRLARAAGFSSGQGFLLCPPLGAERAHEITHAGVAMDAAIEAQRAPMRARG